VIGRAHNLQTFQRKILEVPDRVLAWHAAQNHFSKWLNARAIFPVAQLFKYITEEDFNNIGEVRSYLYEAISSFRISKGGGSLPSLTGRPMMSTGTFRGSGRGRSGARRADWHLSIR
jgi:hypothetical protein